MKCLACDKILSDYEATRKYESNGEFVDLCNECLHASDLVNINFMDRPDLSNVEDQTDEIEGDSYEEG